MPIDPLIPEHLAGVFHYYTYASNGYTDLDAGLDQMMRGAQLPPFPAAMTASRIEVSLTMQFNLT